VSDYRVIVGLRLDRPRTKYNVGFDPCVSGGKKVDSVRSMLAEHLDELRRQSTALQAILIQVSEVVLRPMLERARLLPAALSRLNH
jgi:hypothetical protein